VKKILHIIEFMEMGGAENLLRNTVSELPEYEHLIVTVFAHNDLSLLPHNATHICLGAKHKAEVLLKLPVYRKVLRSFNPHLVHAHLYFATVLAKAATPSRVPLVFTQHFEFSKNTNKWYYAAVDRLVSKKRQACIAVSNAVLKDYVQSTGFKGAKQVIGIYIPDHFFSIQKQTPQVQGIRLVALGNIKAIKNQRYLLNAFALVKDLPVSCDIYGEGDERMQLEEEARQNGIAVHFRGHIDDSAKVLGYYDAYIMPSLTEGFPLALFEAMAAGLPPIVSDIPVFHELLGDLGLYLNLQQPGSLRIHVEQLLQDPQYRDSLSKRARELAVVKASKKLYLEQLRAFYISKMKEDVKSDSSRNVMKITG
jgi:glycosyltransferase involved in cell wall biosynthesis